MIGDVLRCFRSWYARTLDASGAVERGRCRRRRGGGWSRSSADRLRRFGRQLLPVGTVGPSRVPIVRRSTHAGRQVPTRMRHGQPERAPPDFFWANSTAENGTLVITTAVTHRQSGSFSVRWESCLPQRRPTFAQRTAQTTRPPPMAFTAMCNRKHRTPTPLDTPTKAWPEPRPWPASLSQSTAQSRRPQPRTGRRT